MTNRSTLFLKLLLPVAAAYACGTSAYALEKTPRCDLRSKRTLSAEACAEWKQEVARSSSKGASSEGRGGLDAHNRAQENYAYSNCLRTQIANRKSAASARSICAKTKP